MNATTRSTATVESADAWEADTQILDTIEDAAVPLAQEAGAHAEAEAEAEAAAQDEWEGSFATGLQQSGIDLQHGLDVQEVVLTSWPDL